MSQPDPVWLEVACDLEGLRITRELCSGIWELEGWGRRVVVREWTWAERRRLLEACRRGSGFDRQHFVAGLIALCCRPRPASELWPLYAHVVLGLFGIDGARPLANPASAELRLAERFDWDPARVGPQSAIDLDRLLAELEPATPRARVSTPALPAAVPPAGWRRIVIEDDAR
ncbi:hypothetical protein ACNOYE_28255 [Nannocystaceae bacterium ST9]